MNPDQQFVVALGGMVVTMFTAILAFALQVRSLKKHVNSRMDELVMLTAKSSFAEGRLLGPEHRDP